MPQLFYPVAMEISGPTAMWTRPDTGDCPVSYPAPTYSAVKALFESILWGPAVEIIPLKVELCAPVQFHSYVTNYGGPLRKDGTSNYQLFATVLTDVCYKLYASVGPFRQKSKLPESARQWDRKTTAPGHAYQAMFTRRLKRGQCYSIPALGWREFTPAYYGPLRTGTRVLATLPTIVIPSMLRQVFPGGYNSAVSFVYDQDVLIENGCLTYPVQGGPYAQ
jgi:CRISPR-associated protein Cas5, N-terminal domain